MADGVSLRRLQVTPMLLRKVNQDHTATRKNLLVSTLLMLLLTLHAVASSGGANGVQSQAGNPGFENNLTGYTFSPAGSFSVNTNATYVRSGSNSLKISTTTTSDQKAYHTAGAFVAPLTGYLTIIAWVKGENTILRVRTGIYNSSTSTETLAGTYLTPSTGSFASTSGSFACTAGQTYYPVICGKSSTGASGTAEIDDIIMYFSSSSTTDLTLPATPPTAVQATTSGTAITLSWTNGADAESGLEGHLVIRISGVSVANFTANAQVNYSTISSEGPTTISTATIVYNGNGTTFTDNPGVTGIYTYLIYSRDKAYNYSTAATAARMLVVNGTNLSATITSSGSLDGIYLPSTDTLTTASGITLTIKTGAVITIHGYFVESGTTTNNGSVSFASGSTYEFDRALASSELIYATWLSGSLCYITGLKNAVVTGFDQNFANLTWSSTTQNRNITLTSSTTISGNFIITGTGAKRINVEDVVITGNFIQSSGTVQFTAGTTVYMQGNSSQVLNVTGPLSGLRVNNSAGVKLGANLTINATLDLYSGALSDSSFALTLATGTTINRVTGTLAEAPTLAGTINVSYTNAVTTGFELPATGVTNLTLNLGGQVTLNNSSTISGLITFTNGYLVTTTSNLLNIAAGGSVTGASNSSHINGPVKKTGNTAFTFPIGDGTSYAPLTISAPSVVTDQFTAQYKFTDPATVGTKLGAGLSRVSQVEYWNFNRIVGTSNVTTNLTWNSYSGVTLSSNLNVARWNGTDWVTEGNTATTGTTSLGTITSSTVTGYGSFTLASTSSGNNPLPVSLVSFTSECINSVVKLNWSTSSEYNHDRFEIMRSNDADNYELIGTITFVQASPLGRRYSFDDAFNKDLAYYKLIQVDLNGLRTEYGPITSGCDSKELVYIIQNNQLKLVNNSDKNTEVYQLRITDLAGRLIYAQKIQLGLTTTSVQLEHLPTNTILLCDLQNSNGTHFPIKFYTGSEY